MDPNTRLGHVLFQLTPTRTRCDLVVFSGGVNERIASGLLEPFLSHLKSAKDQISKGGYSITLRPTVHSPWFTKATLQRFVKFVSTPEVLERIVTIEKEIVQIENSVNSNEKSNLVAEAEGGRVKKSTANQDGNEENPRIRLQRVLDSRKAMLCKEQAMAYARALVSGYYPESLDDLICFADAFGASRLREACINFLDLCKQKNEDKLWMDEIAAMQASSQSVLPYLRTSGIILAGEDDASSKLNGIDASESTPSHASFDMSQDNSMPPSDGRAQIQMSWPNHLPHYMHNFQGHAFQQMPPPFQGYIYPGMQVPSSYYPPGNMQWPPNVEDSETDHSKSSFKKKKKKKNKYSRVVDRSEEDASTASTESSYESDSDENSRQGKKKKHGKKSSRKVVIRNINYITSKGDGEKGSSSNDEEYINGDSLKRQVEEAVEPLDRRQKSTSRRTKKQHDAENHDADSNGAKGNDNWNAFQNLLLRDDETDAEKQPPKFEEEYIVNKNLEDGRSNGYYHKQDITKTRVVSDDSFIVTGREYNDGQNLNEYFKEGKDAPSFTKKKDSTNDELLFSHRNEESGHYSASTRSGFNPEPSLTKCQKEEDWFIMNQSDKSANEDGNKSFSMFNGVSISSSEKNRKEVLADDSFMIQARSSDNQFNSQSAADLSLVSDIVGASEFAKSAQEVLQNNKTVTSNPHEPDDLYMVLDRDSAVEQSTAVPWSIEMDYENNISLNEANRKSSDVETDKKQQSNSEVANTKALGVRNGKVPSKDAKSKTVNGTLGRSKLDATSRNKASPGSRTTAMKSKSEKEEESRKRKEELLIQRQKRIAERSASKKTGNTDTKTSLNSAKKEKPKVHPSNDEAKKLHKPVLRNSTIDRLATARVTQKVEPSPTKSVPTKKPPLKANGVPLQKNAGTEKKKQGTKEAKSSSKKEDMKKVNAEVLVGTNGHAKNEMKASKVLPVESVAAQSVELNNNHSGLKDNGEFTNTSSEKNVKYLTPERAKMHENAGEFHKDSSLPNHDHDNGGKVSRSDDNLIAASPSPIKPIFVSAVNLKANQEIDEDNNGVSFEAPKKNISTPPPSDQVMPESVHSRKKWNNDEDSSKVAKGFRKLLFFGRRS